MSTNDLERLLDRLFAPLSVDQFRQDCLEREYLHLSGRSVDTYADLFTLADAERILWAGEQTLADSICVVKQRVPIVPPNFERHRLRAWIDEQCQVGATLLVRDVGRFLPSIARLQRAFEGFAGGRVGVNVYLTPPRSQGFPVHFDSHDVIVLQILGTKVWTLHPPLLELATPAGHHSVDAERLGPPSAVLTLQPGDLLYLPRGTIHEARSEETTSLHLTIGLTAPTWGDVLRECVLYAERSVLALRRSPLAYAEPLPEMRRFLAALNDVVRAGAGAAQEVPEDALDAALGRIRARFLARLPVLPRGRLGAREIPATITSPTDWVQRPEGAIVEIRRMEAAIELTLPGMGTADDAGLLPRTLREPLFMEDALAFVARTDVPFRVCELPVQVGDETKVVLARRWLAAGLLERAVSAASVEPMR